MTAGLPRLKRRAEFLREYPEDDESCWLTAGGPHHTVLTQAVGEVSRLFVDAGLIVVSSFISPYKADRDMVRELMQDGEFIEIFVDAPVEVCAERDPKGLYKKAMAGEIKGFTGVSPDAPYEAPNQPELHLRTDEKSVEACVTEILSYLEAKGYCNA